LVLLLIICIYRKMIMNNKRKERKPQFENEIKFVGIALRQMRLNEGKRQIDFQEEGVSRRQIQRAETGNNISLKKLIFMLHSYGYTLKDVDWNN